MSYETITFEQEGPIGTITLKRPERLNAINVQMDSFLQINKPVNNVKVIRANNVQVFFFKF